MRKRSSKQIQNNLDKAKAVIKHHFNKVPKKLTYKPAGQTNFVYEAEIGKENFIVRISTDDACIDDFEKEKWAVKRAEEKGVPVAEIVEVGTEATSKPYMIQRKIKGHDGLTHPDRKRIIQQMAEYCSVINTIPTTGFGKIFDWCETDSSSPLKWNEYLENEIEATALVQILSRNKILTHEQKTIFEENVEEVKKLKGKPVLNHGDMRLKNVIVDDKANIVAILDWERCTSNLAPFWDVSIALHDLSIDNKQIFIEAYKISKKDFLRWSFVYKVLNILNYAKEVRIAAQIKNKQMLEEFRLRLQGGYDIFSFH